MKRSVFSWMKGLSTSGKVLLTASMLALVGIVGTTANSPSIVTKTITQEENIPYSINYQEDENLLTSQTKELKGGVDGKKKSTYAVTYRGTEEIERKKLSEQIITKATPALVAKGVREVTTTTTKENVPYTTSTKTDSTMSKGVRKTLTPGTNGTRTITYEVVKIRGKEISRNQIANEVTTKPVNEVVAIGTKSLVSRASSSCDPNYSGACVPIASDVDCGGGSGNGPAYVYGTVRVIGYDIYDLDRDGDGYGCE